jgi:hypothetical protein
MAGQPSSELETADALIVLDPNTLESNLVVDEDLKFYVAMEFKFKGRSKALLGYLTFEVLYTYESIGRGPEGDLGRVNGKTVAGQETYNNKGAAGTQTTLEVPGGTIPRGLYRLGAVVTFKLGPIQHPIPWPITGFTESPAIQVTT